MTGKRFRNDFRLVRVFGEICPKEQSEKVKDMDNKWIPMRWPPAWQDPSTLNLLEDTTINCLLLPKGGDFGSIATQARRKGLMVAEATSTPSGVARIDGEWPGVKLSESGIADRVSAGPTGNPWIDSNGWKIRLYAALHPDTGIWVDAVPERWRRSSTSYLVAIADACAHGGRWLITLDDELAAGIMARKPDSLETWEKMAEAGRFFTSSKSWQGYRPWAVMGIISDFSGRNEFLSHELLNLTARTNQQYRIILKSEISKSSLSGLRAVLYPDEEPPTAEVRKQILSFVEKGGLLITGPKWGQLPGTAAQDTKHPRYTIQTFGKGRLAVATPDFEDPYLVANDTVVLVSHRHELLRFWNGGAIGSYLTMKPDGKQALVQMVFYATTDRENKRTVRVAGRYRTAKLWTLAQAGPAGLEMESSKDAVELYLPPVSHYAAVELAV